MMRFLADAGISPRTVEFLRRRGHDALHVRDIGLQRASDREIVDRALADSRVVLTFDLDFGEILALGVQTGPTTVVFRLSDERADAVNQHLQVVLDEQTDTLASGALVFVEDTRYRVRRLPIRKRIT
jgi:predicted nuclease of predicted toxin-antitoxin system